MKAIIKTIINSTKCMNQKSIGKQTICFRHTTYHKSVFSMICTDAYECDWTPI